MTKHALTDIFEAMAAGELIQYRYLGGKWVDALYTEILQRMINDSGPCSLLGAAPENEFRVKPSVISINGTEFVGPTQFGNANSPRIKISLENVSDGNHVVHMFSNQLDAHRVYQAINNILYND